MIKTINDKNDAYKCINDSIVSYTDCDNALIAMLLHLEVNNPEVFDKPFRIITGDDIVKARNEWKSSEEIDININESLGVERQMNNEFIMNGRYEIDGSFDNIKYKLEYVDISLMDESKVYGVFEGKWWPSEIPDKIMYAIKVLEDEFGEDKIRSVKEMVNERSILGFTNEINVLSEITAFSN